LALLDMSDPAPVLARVDENDIGIIEGDRKAGA
jgi:hypothetical protein